MSTAVRIVEGPATSTVANASTPAPAPSLRVEGPPGGVVAASARVALRARVQNCAGDEGTCGVTWTCVEGDLTDPTALAAAVETGLTDHILAIKPGALAPGTRYAFRPAGGSAAGLVADVVVDVNARPAADASSPSWRRLVRAPARTRTRTPSRARFRAVTIRASDWGDDARTRLLVRILRRGFRTESLAPLGPHTSSNAIDAWLPSGTRVIRARVADARARRRPPDATVTVRRRRARPPPPPSPSPAAVHRHAILRDGPHPPRERTGRETAPSAPASASAYDRGGFGLLEALLRPATRTSTTRARAQAAKAYADRYAATTPGVVVPDCAGLDPIAEYHEEVARAIRDARDATARTAPGATMTLCAAAALTGTRRRRQASTMENLGATFAAEAAAATAPDRGRGDHRAGGFAMRGDAGE